MSSGPQKNTIKVLIVDDIADTRENLRKLLAFEADIEVVGAAGTGREAVEIAGTNPAQGAFYPGGYPLGAK